MPGTDAAVLRAAAAVVEAQAAVRGLPHLVALANRLLALAVQLTPDRPEHDDQEDTDAHH